jgi:glycosyl transferase family 25
MVTQEILRVSKLSSKIKTTIAIITLDPESDRFQELLSLLSNQGLSVEIVEGVDGRKQFPPLEHGESVDQDRSLKIQLVELTRSEIGCYLSHFRTIKNAYEKGLERICILEDDILIEPDFKEVLGSIEKLSDEIEHVRLMGLKCHKRKDICGISKNHRLTRPVKGLCGTQGYVLNRRGMKKVLQCGSSISEPIDKFYDHFWDIDLRSYCIEPHVIWERPIIKSSIIKTSRKQASKPFSKLLRKHLVKLSRGFKRRAYVFKHWNDFSPAIKPSTSMGKTARR